MPGDIFLCRASVFAAQALVGSDHGVPERYVLSTSVRLTCSHLCDAIWVLSLHRDWLIARLAFQQGVLFQCLMTYSFSGERFRCTRAGRERHWYFKALYDSILGRLGRTWGLLGPPWGCRVGALLVVFASVPITFVLPLPLLLSSHMSSVAAILIAFSLVEC